MPSPVKAAPVLELVTSALPEAWTDGAEDGATTVRVCAAPSTPVPEAEVVPTLDVVDSLEPGLAFATTFPLTWKSGNRGNALAGKTEAAVAPTENT
jgi:hypothetical protein